MRSYEKRQPRQTSTKNLWEPRSLEKREDLQRHDARKCAMVLDRPQGSNSIAHTTKKECEAFSVEIIAIVYSITSVTACT